MKDLGQSFRVILALIGGEAAHFAARIPRQRRRSIYYGSPQRPISALPGNLHATPGPFLDCSISWLCFHCGLKSPNPPDPRMLETYSMLTLID